MSSPISWIKGIVRRPLSRRSSRRSSVPSPILNESTSSEAPQPKSPLSDVAREENDLCEGMESPWPDAPQHELRERSKKNGQNHYSLREAQEDTFPEPLDILPVARAGEMEDTQPYSPITLGESVSESEVLDYLETHKKPYAVQMMYEEQPLEILTSESCTDHDGETKIEMAGLIGEHESSCEEIVGPLPSEFRVASDVVDLAPVRHGSLLTEISDVGVEHVHPPPSEYWGLSDVTSNTFDTCGISKVPQMQPGVEVPPSECEMVSDGVEVAPSVSWCQESQRQPIAMESAPVYSLPSDCEVVSDAVDAVPMHPLFSESACEMVSKSDAVEDVLPAAFERVPDQAEIEEYRRQREAARIQAAKENAERERVTLQEKAREKREEERIQQKLRNLGVCVAGYQWIKQSSGYRCAGGSHFISDSQLR